MGHRCADIARLGILSALRRAGELPVLRARAIEAHCDARLQPQLRADLRCCFQSSLSNNTFYVSLCFHCDWVDCFECSAEIDLKRSRDALEHFQLCKPEPVANFHALMMWLEREPQVLTVGTHTFNSVTPSAESGPQRDA